MLNNLKLYFHKYFSETITEPIFVLGHQKSGTTAVAALLSKATLAPTTLDLTRAISDPATQLKLRYKLLSFDDFIKKYTYEFSKKIVKEPFLTFFYKDLLRIFPDAIFLHIVRDPRDNIRSILNRLNIPGNRSDINPFSYSEIKKTPVWSLAFDSSWMGEPSNSYIDAMSKRWNIFCDNYDPKNQILIRYEDFKNDKEKVIYKLAETLNLPVVESIKNDVNKQFQPKGDNSLSWNEFYGEKNLKHIEQICSKYMERFDYIPVYQSI